MLRLVSVFDTVRAVMYSHQPYGFKIDLLDRDLVALGPNERTIQPNSKKKKKKTNPIKSLSELDYQIT